MRRGKAGTAGGSARGFLEEALIKWRTAGAKLTPQVEALLWQYAHGIQTAEIELDERRPDVAVMVKAVELLLTGMGADLKDPNFEGTPERVARMYADLLTPKAYTWATFPAKSADIVMLRGHKAVGVCPHHLQTVDCTAYVGYIPGERTVGLSKLARVVDANLAGLTLHEDAANAIADDIEKALKPRGMGVVLVGVHGCMRFRGVRSPGDVVVSVMRGTLLANSSARAEFMQVIGRP